MTMPRRVRMCERRQPRSRAKPAPLPPVHTCATPEEHERALYVERFRARYGHPPPPPDAYTGRLVRSVDHDGVPAPSGERIGGQLVVGPVAPPPPWARNVVPDPYHTPDEEPYGTSCR